MPNIKKQSSVHKALWCSYTPTKEDIRNAAWCLNNGIEVSLLPVKGDSFKYQLEIDFVKGDERKRNINPELYEAAKVIEKQYEYYQYYFNKYNKK